MVFLSFNPSVSTADEIGDEGDACTAPGGGEAASAEHPLRYRWIVWQQLMASGKAAQYSEATRQVASCGTVEEFWGVWGRLPQPSELLGKAMVNDAADSFQTVDALMLFRDGIMPQWEDEANAEGGHFQLQLRPALGGGQIDEYWNNIVLGVVGATISTAAGHDHGPAAGGQALRGPRRHRAPPHRGVVWRPAGRQGSAGAAAQRGAVSFDQDTGGQDRDGSEAGDEEPQVDAAPVREEHGGRVTRGVSCSSCLADAPVSCRIGDRKMSDRSKRGRFRRHPRVNFTREAARKRRLGASVYIYVYIHR
ncbi:unnamed protein product [Prorocentrum cordatum]|uniref:Uncharacterized protein n=1 Tax=Prorocentrum cordatum TaxID=2364126 RepID=A0ABN9YG40_9DINO|nr:unnamed protein product [Polarella glacialis]